MRQNVFARPTVCRHSSGKWLRRLAGAILIVGASAGAAHAQWSRQHASVCLPVEILPDFPPSYVASTPGVGNSSPNTQLVVACPAFDTSEQPDSQLTEVRVYVYDGNNSGRVRARACVTFRDGSGGWCSDFVQTGNAFVGESVLTLNAAALSLWNDNDWGYVEVTLPARDGLSLSWVKGLVAAQ